MYVSSLFLWILFPILGACFGSFFNVLIYRMPREMSLIKPGSHCPNCKNKILPWHNIPILSWLFLRGRCANCKETISIKYPFVEFLCTLLGFAAAILTQPDYTQYANLIRGLALFWLMVTVVPIFAIDFKYLLLPDTVTVGGILIGFALSFFEGGIGWLTSLLGIITCGGGLLLFSIVSTKIMKREGMGFGDVKLFASYGAIMGTELTFLTLMMGATLAIAVIIPFRFFTKKEMHLPLPFGPFLGVAALASYLYGDFIFEAIFGFVDGVLFSI